MIINIEQRNQLIRIRNVSSILKNRKFRKLLKRPPPCQYLLSDRSVNIFQEKLLRQQVKRIIEAVLFASSSPITFDKLRQVAETFHTVRPKTLRELIQELQHEYMSQQRAFRLEEIAQGFILRTCET